MSDKLKEMFGELFGKLMEFTVRDEFYDSLGESLEVFYNLKEGEEYEFIPANEFLFLTWFLLDVEGIVNEDSFLIDEFLRRKSDVLSIQEMQICKALQETYLNLLEVKAVKRGVSMTLRDAFTGETFEVNEAMGAEEAAEPGNILFTRVLKLGDQHFLVGAGVFLDNSLKEFITQDIMGAYEEACCEQGDRRSFKDFLKTNGFLINNWIRAYENGELTEEDDGDDGEDGDGDEPKDDDKKK